MVTPRELITVCRQIGGMMEADVDILRITRVLRSQTQNQRLLNLYDDIDHDLTMGRGLADAMAKAPDVFSPFAVSLIRQGEERNNIASAFLRLADFLQKEIETSQTRDQTLGSAVGVTTRSRSTDRKGSGTRPAVAPSNEILSPRAIASSDLLPVLEVLWIKMSKLAALLLTALTFVSVVTTAGWLPPHWQGPLSLATSAFVFGVICWYETRPVGNSDTLPISQDEIVDPTLEDTENTTLDEVDFDKFKPVEEKPLEQLPNRETPISLLLQEENSIDALTRSDATDMLDRIKNRAHQREVETEEEYD